MATMLQSRAMNAVISTDNSVLDAIGEADCNLAIWTRPAPLGLADFTALVWENLRFATSPQTLRTDLPRAFADQGFEPAPLPAAFIDDVAQLCGLFCKAMGLQAAELRLEKVTGNSCRKFHADYVTARLITTYEGQGTQWIDDEENSRVREGGEPVCIHQLQTGDVGLFKGKVATDRPAIHRSPPIASMETGETRLLLVLNPLPGSMSDPAQKPPE